jgi:hypothetical protein
MGIDGSNVTGFYNASGMHGFIYNGTGWTTLDTPGTQGGTYATGIDGGNIVGYYSDGSVSHGFLYDGTNWTTLKMPDGTDVFPMGIDGSIITGFYNASGMHGFLYTIPEPATLLLFGLGGLVFNRNRSGKK